MTLQPSLISQIGQALNDGRGLFLYGAPGNGKTSIAERVCSSFGQCVWIPQIVTIHGELMRIYDPSCHEAVKSPQLDALKYDRRWVLIRRPTIVVGGELTLEYLETRFNTAAGIAEAPVQLKSNCGTLVIDDFGRQRVSSTEILNRLIVPLEKHYDFLYLASGRQIQVPFDELLVLSTNLEPQDLLDEAFLRRIPYKIEIGDPTEVQFRELVKSQATSLGFEVDPDRHRTPDRAALPPRPPPVPLLPSARPAAADQKLLRSPRRTETPHPRQLRPRRPKLLRRPLTVANVAAQAPPCIAPSVPPGADCYRCTQPAPPHRLRLSTLSIPNFWPPNNHLATKILKRFL